jgi:hypothetical protein
LRGDHTLVPLRSRHMYDLAGMVYGAVLGNNGFEDDLIFFDLIGDNPASVAKPHKNTLLHNLITSVIGFYLDYSTGHAADLEVEFYKSLLEEADLKIPKWLNPDQVERHIHKLDGILYDANEIITPTIFYLLFSDRRFLIEFQRRISSYVRLLKFDAHPNFLVCDGVLKRPKYLPAWLKAGVFYRDRGRCQSCFKDLSGLGRPIHDLHLDHIIPLAVSGSNDPTNFQLLCDICNLTKGSKVHNNLPRFSPYW